MSKKTIVDPGCVDRFVSDERDFILHRGNGKKPLLGVHRQTTRDKAGHRQAVLAVPLATLRRLRDLTQVEVGVRFPPVRRRDHAAGSGSG